MLDTFVTPLQFVVEEIEQGQHGYDKGYNNIYVYTRFHIRCPQGIVKPVVGLYKVVILRYNPVSLPLGK